MPQSALCPDCDRTMKVPDDAEGKKIRCPGCRAILLVAEDGLRAGAAKSARKATREDDEEEPARSKRREAEEKPKKKKKKRRGGVPAWVWITGGLAACLLVGVTLVLVLSGG